MWEFRRSSKEDTVAEMNSQKSYRRNKKPFPDEAGVSMWEFRRSSKEDTVAEMNCVKTSGPRQI